MSGEHDNLAQPPLMIDGKTVHVVAPPPPPLRERLEALRANFRAWLAGAPLKDGEIPGMDVL